MRGGRGGNAGIWNIYSVFFLLLPSGVYGARFNITVMTRGRPFPSTSKYAIDPTLAGGAFPPQRYVHGPMRAKISAFIKVPFFARVTDVFAEEPDDQRRSRTLTVRRGSVRRGSCERK